MKSAFLLLLLMLVQAAKTGEVSQFEPKAIYRRAAYS